LPDELVLGGDPVPDGAEGAAAQHAKTLLHLDMRGEPALEFLPGADLVVDGAGAGFDVLDVTLQDLVDESLFAAEIVIELALPRPRGLQDLVGARGADALLVEEIGRRAHDAQPGRRPLLGFSTHERPHDCTCEYIIADSECRNRRFSEVRALYL